MLDRIERLLVALDSGQIEDPDLSNWLRQAIVRHIREGVSLDKGLNVSGSRSKYLLDRRDFCLICAAQVLEQDSPGSIWHRSARLAELLARFHDGRWRLLEFKPEPDDLDELDRWLFRALKTGQKVIGHKQVYNILVKSVGRSNFSNLAIDCYRQNYKLDERS